VGVHPLLRKLLSPVGFLFVAVCFLLPFATVSCSTLETGRTWATYTGVDLAARQQASDVHLSDEVRKLNDPNIPDDPGGKQNEIDVDGPVSAQPLMVAALVVAIAGIFLGWLRRPWPRALATAGAALIAAILLAGAELIALHAIRTLYLDALLRYNAYPGVTQSPPMDVQPRYGFWLALLLCLALAGFNGVTLLRLSRGNREQPEQASAVSLSG
jgi:hypothetical protein